MNEWLEKENEGTDDKEEELGLNVRRDFCVSDEKSVVGDEGVRGFGGVSTRTEGADNCVCGKGEKGGEANVEEAVMF
ncbi:uncharacterized protein MONOS_813 [Monocercomonoides exilis]|uniref:uncharacterized protein n=1 Tax=Monocercomonoides exilis TaxID=2049356 RepID=UPI00355A06C8|nr:hypothetical protein MONOS_813 [Monocercomonoides exilis]|eukprot:MONOS_813.1-p1 / transcript=MONOS_813.1 / gene=MONOS_813 / organism=Monocercomonoides_exilis_PA203 / gene_product=unspecified product / transcript_product=unspecified product / location=Mono_scaffold00013:191320-191550(+) / protein_length=77 / sequence_SO=supercontig / SO=protein_coding / is_pseudo=false